MVNDVLSMRGKPGSVYIREEKILLGLWCTLENDFEKILEFLQ